MAVKQKVNIVAVVDVIGALSDGTLGNGNLCLIDDGPYDSRGQGTPQLETVVAPGQTVQWTALAVDLQTPVEIKSITFVGQDDDTSHRGNGAAHRPHESAQQQHPGQRPQSRRSSGSSQGLAQDRDNGDVAHQANGHKETYENLELAVWSGVVPYHLTPGTPLKYRLELQMYEGPRSTLTVESAALVATTPQQ
ncbi:hypothetical protein GCM10010329_40460 [Streptomyces spiroverticillatus]|uniref:Uncharacterized protein n=1 Tax=Streptomyces finlayi TaxID=67296 RepID=A0A919CB55_9ACTN|nr:hypothetical protein [Streptomyces finlayi]GHA13533.1 hypothetical protein GCM10010329_40460 [Streptomyces spiroverticillatus]GHC97884.1 hypothetical protein GCM10010334_39780 [Streptomyces finlayi]